MTSPGETVQVSSTRVVGNRAQDRRGRPQGVHVFTPEAPVVILTLDELLINPGL